MTQKNREVVQNAWRAFAGRDVDRISAFFTAGAEWLAPAGNATAVALGVPSHMVGGRAIARFIAEDFPRLFVGDVTVAFSGFYADGDRVIVEETMSATLADGGSCVNDYCFVFEVQDGLIHRVREYMDTARGHRMVSGGTNNSPPAGTACPAWAPAGPAEAWSASTGCANRRPTGSTMSPQETGGRVARLVPQSIGPERT
jgi:ketosteroid isomerase-like protein